MELFFIFGLCSHNLPNTLDMSVTMSKVKNLSHSSKCPYWTCAIITHQAEDHEKSGEVPINTRFLRKKKYRGHLPLERDIIYFHFPSYAMFKSDRTSLHLSQTNSGNTVYSLFTFLSAVGGWKWCTDTCRWNYIAIRLQRFYMKPTSFSVWGPIHQPSPTLAHRKDWRATCTSKAKYEKN